VSLFAYTYDTNVQQGVLSRSRVRWNKKCTLLKQKDWNIKFYGRYDRKSLFDNWNRMYYFVLVDKFVVS
jgi:hypothetical protein